MPKADSKYPLVITIILLAGGIYFGIMFGTPYWKSVKLGHDLEEIVNWDKFKERRPPTREKVMADTLKAAKLLELPVKEKNVKIEGGNRQLIAVTVNYVYRIEVPLYGNYDWHFTVARIERR